MKLTIAITNFNRAWYLDRSLRLLAQQTFPKDDYEVVVVDDGSIDVSDHVIEHIKSANLIKNFSYYRKKYKRVKYGNCAIVRNIGITTSTGKVIVFTDPEVMPMKDWAQKHYLAHCQGDFGEKEVPDESFVKTTNFVMGRAMLLRYEHAVGGLSGKLLGDVFNEYNWFNIEETYKKLEDKINSLPVTEKQKQDEFFIYQFSQAGISLTRELLMEIGGFEENFANPALGLDKWGGEDYWLMHCCNRIGKNMKQVANIKAIHLPHTVDNGGAIQCKVSHDRARENPDLCKSNVGRKFGSLDDFEKVF